MKQYYIELSSSFALLLNAAVLRLIFKKIIKTQGKKYDLDAAQQKYVVKFFNIIVAVLFFIVLIIIWDLSVKGLSIYVTSVFTIVGVALFANWSILSNITASILLFFNSPFKIGSKIEILDNENGIKGTVTDINWFSIQILSEDNEMISYPTNLAIQKPIKKLKN